ncbi:MAG: YqhA family protein [Proteobacteria bacterium]|nr:YqhA family protein [Pseudomonadota bacterium]
MFNYLLIGLLSISRLFVFLPVLFGIISAIILFAVSTLDMCRMIYHIIQAIWTMTYPESLHLDIVSDIIGSVDLYLIAIVLLIFSFGLYELFISKTMLVKTNVKLPPILAINSLDELKDKLAKVIVMVLVVSFFQHVLYLKYQGPLEMMYFAFSISALSVGVYLLHKDLKFKKKPRQRVVPGKEHA